MLSKVTSPIVKLLKMSAQNSSSLSYTMFSVLFSKYRAKRFVKDAGRLYSHKGTAHRQIRQATGTDRPDICNRQTTDRPVSTNYRQTQDTREGEDSNWGSLLV